jgi:hypothetical protein
MAAKGAQAKQAVFAKMLEAFPDSFMYNDGKELRINMMEDGAVVQIKVALTAAKVAVDNPNATPAANAAAPTSTSTVVEDGTPPFDIEPSAEEKARLSKLMSDLGF